MKSIDCSCCWRRAALLVGVWLSVGLVAQGQGFFNRGNNTQSRPATKKTNTQTAAPPKAGKPQQSPPATRPGTNPPAATATDSGEAQWIWAPGTDRDKIAPGIVYFRKTFDTSAVDLAMCQITCDDKYDLYINGQLVGSGNDWRLVQTYDIAKFLVNGRNVISIRAENTDTASAGLVARISVRRKGGTDVSYDTDPTWRVNQREVTGWQSAQFNDSRWVQARSFGEFGVAQPWGDKVVAADGTTTKRFTINNEYKVERLVASEPFKSLLAMAFNEFGEILVSQEKGPIQLIADQDQDGIPETLTTYCEAVTSCQGLLPLSGEVFAVGHGPQGAGLYRISDADQDGKGEKVTMLFAFEPDLGEHGPHGLALGPDGMIYVMIGNHAQVKTPPSPKSPYRNFYEGDLFTPKYEDPQGHAVGIKAPGGTIVRTDIDGASVELFAGGFRNAYDLAFNRAGELFTFDSDMESDMLMPWYRPTRVLHVAAGADYGSRSGWSVWPNYFVDGLPPIVEPGRGSPTGVEFYDDHRYPAKYHGAMFLGDWSQGRILAVRMVPKDGSYQAVAETFVEGRPLNVVDLAVGPDGWLYFCTGGRGTDGGVYRIVWKGEQPPEPEYTGILQAIHQPQLNSAYSRQLIALIQEELGEQWDEQLKAHASNATKPADERTRALDLMLLFGTVIESSYLDRLAEDRDPKVRAKAAYLMGVQPDESHKATLATLLADRDALVRRTACDSITRGEYQVTIEPLVKTLGDNHRFVGHAARRAIERQPVEAWKSLMLKSENMREFLLGSTALMVQAPSREHALEVVANAEDFLAGFVTDDDFIDLLRVLELAASRGGLKRADVPTLSVSLAEEFPAGESRINRELARLIAYLQEPSALPRMVEYLKSDASDTDKLQVALHLRYITDGWQANDRLEMLRYLDRAQLLEGGNSMAGYIENVRRDFCRTMPKADRDLVLKEALKIPGAALSVLAVLEEAPDQTMVRQLIAVDRAIPEAKNASEKKLQTAIIAMLAISGQSDAMAYMRELYEQVPERRGDLAMGLAQQPQGENWQLLVRSLGVLDGAAAQEVLLALAKVNQRPKNPESFRQTIMLGLKLKENGGQHAVKLLGHWTGENPAQPGAELTDALTSWQGWYAVQFPDAPPAELPVESQESRWNYQQLVTYLTTDKNGSLPGNPIRGLSVFNKANCTKCHRYNGTGEAVGPDLSAVAQRFQRKELIESIMFPSQVISDQYASKTVTTVNGLTYTGMAAAHAAEVVILQSNGEKVSVLKRDIDEMVPSKKSAMPEGLLNPLTLEEIADLVAMLSARSQGPATAARPRAQ